MPVLANKQPRREAKSHSRAKAQTVAHQSSVASTATVASALPLPLQPDTSIIVCSTEVSAMPASRHLL